MTKTTRKASPAQLAALAAGRAKAKAKRDATPAPVTLDFVQLPTGPVETLDHAGARSKLRLLGLQAAQLPGRGKAIQLAGWTITNAKGKFSFASDTPPQPKATTPADMPPALRDALMAWISANGLKI